MIVALWLGLFAGGAAFAEPAADPGADQAGGAVANAVAPPATTVPPALPIDPVGEGRAHGEASAALTLAVYGVLGALSLAGLWWLWRRDAIRPGSFARAMPEGCRQPWRVPTLIWGAGVLIIFTAQSVGYAFVAAFPRWMGTAGSPRFQTVAYIGVFVVSVAAAGIYAACVRSVLREPGLLRRAGLGMPWTRDVGKGLGALALVMPMCLVAGWAAASVAEWIGGRPIEPIAHDMLRTLVEDSADPWSWGLVGIAVVGAPVVEELLFRVFLQSTLVGFVTSLLGGGGGEGGTVVRTAGSPGETLPMSERERRIRGAARWIGIVTASVLFALMHVGALRATGGGAGGAAGDGGGGGGGMYALVPLFVLAVALGTAYERTGRWLVPMTMHAGFNALNIGLALVTAGKV